MEAVRSSEIWARFYQTAISRIPEDSKLRTVYLNIYFYRLTFFLQEKWMGGAK
jgi:hypothetical protein